MSAPRTMSEEQEREVRARRTPFILALAGELDAERAAYATLEQDYAQAVRALRETRSSLVRLMGVTDTPDGRKDFGVGMLALAASAPDATAMTDALRCLDALDHSEPILSTPRAQAVKEVE